MALAGAVLSGCAKTDVVSVHEESGEIFFDSPVPHMHTKADLVKNLYPENISFCVFADQHFDIFINTDSEGFTPYMRGNEDGGEGVEVKHSTVSLNVAGKDMDSYWRPDKSYMWPKEGHLTFAAYSPASVREHAQINYTPEYGVRMTDYTVDTDPDKHYDLMFSRRTTDQRKEDMVVDGPSPYDGVQIVFEHVLSAIAFNVQAHDAEYAEWGYSITPTKLSVHNVYSTADFRQFAGYEGDDVDKAGMWTGLETLEEYIVYSSGDPLGQGREADLILLPQPLSGEGREPVKMELGFEMSHPDMGGKKTSHSIIFDLSQGKMADDTAVDRWEPGKRYIYTVTIGLNTIEFSPEVYAWEDHQVPDLPPLDKIPSLTMQD